MKDSLIAISTKAGTIYVKPSHVSAIAAVSDESGRPIPGCCALVIMGATFPLPLSMESVYKSLTEAQGESACNEKSTLLAA